MGRSKEASVPTVERRGQPNLVALREDFALLTMHVLFSAIFGNSCDYGVGLQQVEPSHKLSCFASLAFILQNVASDIVFKDLKAPDWLLPSYLRKLKLIVAEYQQYLTEAVEQEQKAGATKRLGASLVSALVRANEDAKNEEKTTGGLPMYLSDDELYGNIYIFNLGGFETTSFALSFTIPHLAIDPDLQDWIQEEINELYKSQSNKSKSESGSGSTGFDYESAYGRLPRCRALMYETLRYHQQQQWCPEPLNPINP